MPEAYSVAEPDSEGKEACKPEDHRQPLDTSDDTGVVCLGLGEAHRHHGQVGEGDQCEDRAEEEEGDLRRCAGIPVAAPPVDDCVDLLVLCFGHAALMCEVAYHSRSVRVRGA
jgi:hypothetical protein